MNFRISILSPFLSVSCLPSWFLRVSCTEITNLLPYYDNLTDLHFCFLKRKAPKHTFYTIYLIPTRMLRCHLCLVFPNILFPPGLRLKFYKRPQDCLEDRHVSSLRIFFFRNVVLLYGIKRCLIQGISNPRLVSFSWVLLSHNDINIFMLHFLFFFNFELFLKLHMYV
jgi:hypothetical protein